MAEMTATKLITDLAEWLARDDVLDESTRAEYAQRLAAYAKPASKQMTLYAPKEEACGR